MNYQLSPVVVGPPERGAIQSAGSCNWDLGPFLQVGLKARWQATLEASSVLWICFFHAQTRRQNKEPGKEASVWLVVLDNHLNL
jgi:hypothetical protein